MLVLPGSYKPTCLGRWVVDSVPMVTHDSMMGEVVPNITSFDCFTKIVLEMFILKRFFP